mmetsp:Transcript_16837/g.27291  ORF Transcript_16837/g.27291 Transcript_16837/m.27291 type:complete len:113 (-) Transcript_16837:985-1323(-)
MAQGKITRKAQGPPRRKAGRQAIAKARKRHAPVKQKRNKRDPKMSRLLHNNIERLAAAKAVKNDSGLRLKELTEKGKEQLKVENMSTKKKTRTKEEAELKQLENAKKKVVKA